MKFLVLLILLINLILNPKLPISAPSCPITSLSGLQESSPFLKGTVPSVFVDASIYVYKEPVSEGELIGFGVVDKDATFTVFLCCPIRIGDSITIYFAHPHVGTYSCTYTLKSPPPTIPEPTTLLLVGGGLTALGLRVLRSRR